MEVAALGLKIDGIEQVDRATTSLGNLSNSSKQAEQSAGRLAGASKKSSRDIDEFAQSSRRAEQSTDRLAVTAKRAAGVIVGAFAGIKLTGLIKDVALANSRFEQLGAVMGVVGRNAGLSATEMNRYAKEVEGMGISLTESRNTVIRMVQAQLDLSKAAELARLAQDAAVIANTNSSDALGRLIYGLQSGQVEILRTMGLNVNFANSYSNLSKELGVNADQLSEAQKAQARMNAVIEAGTQIAGAYEASMDSASKQLGSTVRYVQDLAVTIGGVFSDATIQAVFGYSDALKEMSDRAKALAEDGTLANWSKNLAEAISSLTRGLVTGAKVYAAYLASVYAIPAAKGAASLATAAYGKVIAAFTVQVDSATAQLTLMQKAVMLLQRSLSVAFAGFTGWEIGSWLRREFEIAEKAGIALASGIHQSVIFVGGFLKGFGADVSFAMTSPLAAFQNRIVDIIEWLKGLGERALRFMGLGGFADSLAGDMDRWRTEDGRRHNEYLAGIAADTRSKMAEVSDVYAEMFAQVGASAGAATKPVVELGAAAVDTGKEVAALSKELATQLEGLLAHVDPVLHAEMRLAKQRELLAKLTQHYGVSQEAVTKWLEKEEAALKRLRNPLSAVISDYAKETRILRDTHRARETGNYYLLAEVELRRQGLDATAETIAALAREMRARAEWEQQIEDQKRIAEENARVWEEATNRVDQAFADAWAGSLRSFGDFADRMKDAFRQLLAELAHQAITRPILIEFAAAMGLGGSSSGGGALSTVSNVGSAFTAASALKAGYGLVQGGWNAAGLAGVGTNLGSMFGGSGLQYFNTAALPQQLTGNSITGALSSQGGMLSGMKGMLSNPYTWIIAGMMASGKLYSAGVRPSFSGMWDSAGNNPIAQAGTLVTGGLAAPSILTGKALEPIVGGRLAAILSGSTLSQYLVTTINEAIFGGSYQTTRGGIQLGFGDEGFDPMAWERQTKKGGLFGSTSRRFRYSELDGELDELLEGTYRTTVDGVKELYETIGVSLEDGLLESVRIATAQIGTSGKSKQTEEEIQQQISDWFLQLQESLVSYIEPSFSFERLSELAFSLTSVNAAMERLRGTLLEVSPAGAMAAESLINLVGGFDNLTMLQQQYYDLFFSEQEKFQHLQEDLTAAFGDMNKSLPATAAEFRALIESTDLMTEAGREQYATLLQLSPAVKQYTDALNEQARAAEAQAQAVRDAAQLEIDRLVADAFSALQRAVQAEQAAIRDQINSATEALRAAESVANLLGRSLRAMRIESVAFDRQQRQAAQASLITSLAMYRAGGILPDADRLQRDLDIIARPSQQLFGSFEEYQRDFWRTANVIADLEQAAGKQVTIEQATLTELEAQSAALDGILANAQAQLDALNGVETGLLTVAEALRQFESVAGQASRVPATPSTDPLTAAYQKLFGRNPDAAGAAYWQSELATGKITLEQLEEALKAGALGSDVEAMRLRGFASGGYHAGGWAVVGEKGPEVVNFGSPAQIYSNGQSRNLMDNGEVVAELRQIRIDMREQNRAIIVNTLRTEKILSRWDGDGLPREREDAL